MAGDDQVLRCIILTTRSELVLVPNAAIAEIVPVQDVRSVENKPRWYLGDTRWRGVDLPLVSFEAAAGDEAQSISINTQVAVLYTTGQSMDRKHPYVGLIISGVPHVSRFTREQIRLNEDVQNNHPMVAQKVRVNGAAVNILDLDGMENMLDEVA